MEYHRLPNSLSNSLGGMHGVLERPARRRGGGRETDNPLTFIPLLFVTFISTTQTLPLGVVQPEGSHKPTTGHVLCPRMRHYKTKKEFQAEHKNFPAAQLQISTYFFCICIGRTTVDMDSVAFNRLPTEGSRKISHGHHAPKESA